MDEFVNQVKKFMEDNSYFEFYTVSPNNDIEYSTRQNGNVGDEKYGEADMEEARRIKKLLKSKLPKIIKDVEFEGAEEWVFMNIKLKKDEKI
jgi:hypothetical protein